MRWRELVNIGVSRAAASLGTMVGEQVLLSVPSVVVVSRSQAAELISALPDDLLVAVRQAFNGDVSGRALLIFPEKNSLELVRAVAGEDLSLEDILELEHEALAEIGNIILNACMATVANLLQRSLTMSLPEIIRGTSERPVRSGGVDGRRRRAVRAHQLQPQRPSGRGLCRDGDGFRLVGVTEGTDRRIHPADVWP